MSVTYVEGDIFATEGIKAYAHGCNCAGAMGAGIAVEFKRRWPAMYHEYQRLCRTGYFKPGSVYRYSDAEGTVIYNLGTQAHWKTGATPAYIESSLEAMLSVAQEKGDTPEIVMPQIGAGLGGLPWARVKGIIDSVCAATEVNVIVCEYRKGVSFR